ncbi:hypothetical protein F5Y16DRAFT_409177 [Xylariaceae sp. FL0255]|nr:hypothetical protein F5Y16DRAFT_409177 [Xylariaceae sp. FL0255]
MTGVVGIHYEPNGDHFSASLKTYNGLPDDADQPEVPEQLLKTLAGIFVRHNAHKYYGLHLVHGHSKAPTGTIMLGKTFTKGAKNICWTKPVTTLEVNGPIHGHIYKLTGDAFIPYEYREGELPMTFTDVSKDFFQELARFLTSNNLDNLLGLEVLDRKEDLYCGEYVLGHQGTVLVEQKDIVTGVPFRKTQFVFDLNGNQEPDPIQPGTHHEGTTKSTHRVFVTKTLRTVDDVMDVLRAEHIVG